jgi:hypothetical protein
VLAVEFNEAFAQSMREELRSFPNAELIVGEDYRHLSRGPYDVVSIDGYPRIEATRFILDKVAADGLIIVDNSDVQSLTEIGTLLGSAGYYRIDLFGHSPAAYFKQCTSIFFKEAAFFGWPHPVPPVSRRSLSERLR